MAECIILFVLYNFASCNAFYPWICLSLVGIYMNYYKSNLLVASSFMYWDEIGSHAFLGIAIQSILQLALKAIFWLFDIFSCFVEDEWNQAPKGRFRMLVSIRGPFYGHFCTGIAISNRFILTSAFCYDSIGPNPIIVVGPNSRTDNRWSEGVEVSLVLFWCPKSWLAISQGRALKCIIDKQCIYMQCNNVCQHDRMWGIVYCIFANNVC